MKANAVIIEGKNKEPINSPATHLQITEIVASSITYWKRRKYRRLLTTVWPVDKKKRIVNSYYNIQKV